MLMKKKKGGAVMKTDSPQMPQEPPKAQSQNQYEQGTSSSSNAGPNDIEGQM